MKAVITVLGKDTVGILAKVASVCAKYGINVTDVNQTILDDMFAMLMMVQMDGSSIGVAELASEMKKLGEEMGLVIYVISEAVFDSMHHI